MKIAVLIPCFNEELTIAKVIKDFNKVQPNAVIYVLYNIKKVLVLDFINPY
jgi:glycosyltransferase involved in cell wall biosynthesis